MFYETFTDLSGPARKGKPTVVAKVTPEQRRQMTAQRQAAAKAKHEKARADRLAALDAKRQKAAQDRETARTAAAARRADAEAKRQRDIAARAQRQGDARAAAAARQATAKAQADARRYQRASERAARLARQQALREANAARRAASLAPSPVAAVSATPLATQATVDPLPVNATSEVFSDVLGPGNTTLPTVDPLDLLDAGFSQEQQSQGDAGPAVDEAASDDGETLFDVPGDITEQPTDDIPAESSPSEVPVFDGELIIPSGDGDPELSGFFSRLFKRIGNNVKKIAKPAASIVGGIVGGPAGAAAAGAAAGALATTKGKKVQVKRVTPAATTQPTSQQPGQITLSLPVVLAGAALLIVLTQRKH